MKKVILASGNKGKLSELQSYLTRLNIELIPQPKTLEYEVEETGTTFVENAIIKARHAAKLSGLPVIADDSGLMIDALDFQPGVYTARYAGVGCSSQDNIDLILKNLKSYPDLEQRKATFICVLVYMESAIDPLPVISLGTWRGAIYPKMMGESGFGYDPIFWDFKNQMTAAQMSKELKSSLSHRGQACRKLLKKLTMKNKLVVFKNQ
jgi:XTP/dITP diphosphohydrolase